MIYCYEVNFYNNSVKRIDEKTLKKLVDDTSLYKTVCRHDFRSSFVDCHHEDSYARYVGRAVDILRDNYMFIPVGEYTFYCTMPNIDLMKEPTRFFYEYHNALCFAFSVDERL